MPGFETSEATHEAASRWMRWMRGLRVYADRRMLVLLGLGFASGLPLKLVYATLALWLASEGIDKATVGLLGLASLPYSLKFVWAPALDHLSLGRLEAWLGRRRAWILLSQAGLLVSILAMATTVPASGVMATAAAALVVAFMSATQDIAVDGYRVELLEPEEQGAGTAMFVVGYRIGMLAAGAGALHLVAELEDAGGMGRFLHGLHGSAWYPEVALWSAWNVVYAVLATSVCVGMVATLAGPRPPVRDAEPEPSAARAPRVTRAGRAVQRVGDAVLAWVRPFVAFVRRRGWLAVVAFLLFYKLGDALASAMTNTFLYELGFTLRNIADVRDTWGLVASIVGIAFGGVVVRAMGLRRSLWLSLGLMMMSNLLFSWLAVVGPRVAWLAWTIGVENLTGGIATAAFVAWLSAQCERRHAAAQYALLTSLAAMAHIVLGAGSGWLAERTGWVIYFGATALASLPAVLVLWRRPIHEAPPG